MTPSACDVDPALLTAWKQGLDEVQQASLAELVQLDQAHLLQEAGLKVSLSDRHRLLDQWAHLNRNYPGGLKAYLRNARILLRAARTGDNPYAGLVPQVPRGRQLHWGTTMFAETHARGLSLASRTGFVLVAGGMGERLGYPGIKLGLPVESVSGRCFLQFYIEQILALQARSDSPRPLPLALMTSGQTHAATVELLQKHRNFGMAPNQVTLMRQEEVPALADDRPSLIADPEDPCRLQTKPHGHGDVHSLMHTTGTAARWADQGIEYLVFFQDTNALVFNAIPSTLAVSEAEGFVMNTITVPRKAGEAVGGIAHLSGSSNDGSSRSLTVNVEYNQLDPLLRASGSPGGDVGDEAGFSPFPGNTNALVLKLRDYVETLQKTAGGVPEFVNPKYADEQRTQFLKPTRLECMMQDYPRALPSESQVGFTSFEREVCFSAVKNALADAARRAERGLPAESASSAEADFFALQRRMLSQSGAELEHAEPATFGGLQVSLFPIVVLSAQMLLDAPLSQLGVERGVTHQDLKMSARSSLMIVEGRVRFEGVTLDGDLEVRAHPRGTLILRDLSIENEGRLVEVAGADAPAELAIRGYRPVRKGSCLIDVPEPGEHVIDAKWLEAHMAEPRRRN